MTYDFCVSYKSTSKHISETSMTHRLATKFNWIKLLKDSKHNVNLKSASLIIKDNNKN